MQELKSVYIDRTGDWCRSGNNTGNFYLKSEVDAVLAEKDAEIRRLKRALYKACANWAKSERYTEATWHGDEHREELWANVQAKCRAKAEKYK